MIKYIQKLSIPQMIVVTYALLITFGSLLLWLPISSASGEWTSLVDALFTATSATAVTGQITLTTATHWNLFGKTVILLLIQIGGLGFMTIWMLFYYNLAGRRPNLKQRRAASESLSLSGGDSVQQKVWSIIRFSLTVQAIGAVLLAVSFLPEYGGLQGIYFSVFHSISAFNNAGFDLIGNSLVTYQESPYVLLVFSGLIMAGGLGFIVWEDLLNYKNSKELRRYSKLVLVTTVSLWVIGTLLFWLAESQNTAFSDLSIVDQLTNSFFLSVTPRTAGFSNLEYGSLSQGSVFLTILLMFIGATSASTGGGIKVTTLAVILIVIYRHLSNRPPIVLNRKIAEDTIRRAFFIFSVGIILIGMATFILLITEDIPPNYGIEYVLMEVVSCISTVGLTMGLTPDLSIIGKFVLIFLMLVGRVGVMTFLWSIAGEKRESRLNYPEMNILIG